MSELLIRRPLLVKAGSDPIDNYVTSGLVLWLDGIKNTRSGHNASSTKWEDLSGNGYDCTYNASSTVDALYCVPNAGLTLAKNLTIPSTCTIEIVLKSIPNSSVNQMVAAQGDNQRTVWINKSGNVVFGASTAKVFAYADLPAEVNTVVNSGYLNGAAYTVGSSSASWNTAYKSRLFAYSSNTTNKTTSRIYAIRVYDRELSASEILQNYNADKVRFNSGVVSS